MEMDYVELAILITGLIMFVLSIFGKEEIKHKCLVVGWILLIYHWVAYK